MSAGKFSVTIDNADGSTTTYASDVANFTVTTTPPPIVVPPPPPLNLEPVIPAAAKVIDMLGATGWKMNHDAGTPGSSVGTTGYPVTAPDGTQNCRLFDFTNTGGGGEIYHLHVLEDSTPYKNFCVELEEMSPSWAEVTNCEIDMEQVDASGNPLDMATQEDGYSGVFDVTENHKWVGTGIKVNPAARAANSHHTKKIYLTNAGNGQVFYPGVNIDGTFYPIKAAAADVDNSKWAPKLLNLQVQFDTKSVAAIESKVYFSKLTVYAW